MIILLFGRRYGYKLSESFDMILMELGVELFILANIVAVAIR